jgi:hypothetical protein
MSYFILATIQSEVYYTNNWIPYNFIAELWAKGLKVIVTLLDKCH